MRHVDSGQYFALKISKKAAILRLKQASCFAFFSYKRGPRRYRDAWCYDVWLLARKVALLLALAHPAPDAMSPHLLT